jgi:hypothetical protein
MLQSDQQERTHLLERYVALWNEGDAGRRRQLIAQLWEEDGVQFTPQHEYRGYRALEERVTQAYEEFVHKNGFVFKLSNTPQAHHQALTLSWEMVPAGGGEVAAVGTVFLLLGDAGRIRADYQF